MVETRAVLRPCAFLTWLLFRFRAIQILLVQGFLLVVERSELSLDEEIAHLGGELERITVGHDDIGNLAALEGANLIGETKNFGWIQGHGLQRFVIGKTVGHGVRRLLAQAARKRIVKAAEGKFYAGGSQLRGLRQQAVVWVVFFAGQRQRWAKNYRNALGAQQVLYFVRFGATGENHF